MYRLPLFLLSLMLWAGLCAYGQEKTDSVQPVTLTSDGVLTYESNGTQKTYKKVLVASFGDIMIRHITDNIYMALKAHYDKRQIAHASSHLGNARQTVGEKLNIAVKQHQPDAVLTIYGSSSKDTMTYKDPAIDPRIWKFLGQAARSSYDGAFNSRPVPDGSATSSTNKNSRTSSTYVRSSSTRFMAVLMDPADYKVLWKGEIFIFSNTSKNKTFEKISGLLVDEWVRNKILDGLATTETQN